MFLVTKQDFNRKEIQSTKRVIVQNRIRERGPILVMLKINAAENLGYKIPASKLYKIVTHTLIPYPLYRIACSRWWTGAIWIRPTVTLHATSRGINNDSPTWRWIAIRLCSLDDQQNRSRKQAEGTHDGKPRSMWWYIFKQATSKLESRRIINSVLHTGGAKIPLG